MNTRISRRARNELIRGLRQIGIAGKTVLDVGCGPGDLTRELLRQGASRALGMDLAEATLDEARRRSNEERLSDRLEFRVGNGATERLDPHDIVVLDKVICCYPDWHRLIDNTSGAARSAYGFVIPRSDGINGLLIRAFLGIGNLFLKLRKCGFRPYVHDYAQIHVYMGELAFERRLLSRGPVWMAAIYARP